MNNLAMLRTRANNRQGQAQVHDLLRGSRRQFEPRMQIAGHESQVRAW
jgi:hypothetical protein